MVETQIVLLGQKFNLYLNKTVKIKDTDLELILQIITKVAVQKASYVIIWAGKTTTTINVNQVTIQRNFQILWNVVVKNNTSKQTFHTLLLS